MPRCGRSPGTRRWSSWPSGSRTIVDADQIVVLEDGEVVGLGTHDELLAGCPTYAEIVESQRPAEAVA